MLHPIADRSTGPAYSADDSGSDAHSGGVCWVHAVWLVLSHVTPTQTQDGEGTRIFTDKSI